MVLSPGKKIAVIGTLALALLSGTAPGISQTEHWDTRKRAKSQRLTSSAMNFLKERNRRPRKSDALLDVAITLLTNAVKTDDSDPVPHYLLGLCLSIRGRYEQGLDTLRRAYQLDPGEPEILLSTGITQYLNGDYQKAISLWEKLSDKVKNKAPVCALLGFAYMRSGDFQKAEGYFEESRKRSANCQLAYQGLAILNYLKGDLNQSRQMAEQAETLGDYPLLMLLLARLDFIEGDETGAAQKLKTWNRLSSKSRLPRSMTAMGYSTQHDFHFDPFENEIYDSPGAMLARAISDQKKEKRRKSYSKQGKVDQSISLVQKRTTLNPNDFIALHEKGMLQLSSADYKGAVSSFQAVLNICPNCRVDLIYLSEALAKTGSAANAKQCLEYYKKTFPDQKLAARYEAIATISSAEQSAAPASTPATTPPVPRLPGEGPPGQPGSSSITGAQGPQNFPGSSGAQGLLGGPPVAPGSQRFPAASPTQPGAQPVQNSKEPPF